ncbi:hypothetical protein PInf_013659 [Phytophthora infestans]|nr:hypothetical protein PInf_013659 [Phytophthora infestans]
MDALQTQHQCQNYGNSAAWWNSQISLRFLEYHFANGPNIEDKMLLLWDDFSGHWTPEVVEYAASINIVLHKVPPRYTYVCQPADVAWNHPFKSKLRKFRVDRLRQQVADHHALEVSRAAQRLGITTHEGDEANDEIPALVKELKKLGVVREEQGLTCDEDED